MTGICIGTESSHIAALESQTVFYESRGGNIHGYTNNSYPNVSDVNSYLTISYYDDYNFPGAVNYSFNVSDALDVNKSNKVVGNITAEKVKVLGISSNIWLTTVSHYNDKNEIIQTVSDLYPSGTEVISTKYDFTGNIVENRVRQSVNGLTTVVRKYNSYDSHGRLKKVSQKIDGDAINNTVELAALEYDELGRVKNKKIHNKAETIGYTYDIGGRVTSVSCSKFRYNLGYDNTGGLPSAKSYYGGNISYMGWQNGTGANRAYVYNYDSLNQLKKADFLEKSGSSWVNSSKYDVEGLEYDDNGNIEGLVRKNGSGGILHNLSYAYSGNKLTSVNTNGSKSSGYLYNENGNMTFDGRKGINISYNILNLPEKISKGSQSILYIYSAAGEKLAMEFGSSLIYYRGGFIYSGNSLDRIIHEEGLVVKTSGGYSYYYALKDHLGSTRVLCKGSGTSLITEQTTEYYPFGLAYSYNSVDKNAYLFSGKEYQNEVIGGTKLELYDFGSRFYDTEIGRWSAVDPALQLVSPYGYCGNNPMIYVDPDGEWFFTFILPVAGPFIDAFLWSATIDYATQVATNYINKQQGEGFSDWAFKNVDFLDVGISGVTSVATMGMDKLYKAGKIGKTLFNSASLAIDFGMPAISSKFDLRPKYHGITSNKNQEFMTNYIFSVGKQKTATSGTKKIIKRWYKDTPWILSKNPVRKYLTEFASDLPAIFIFDGWKNKYENSLIPKEANLKPIIIPLATEEN